MQAADNLLISLAGFIGREDLTLHGYAIHPEGELADYGIKRQREDVGAFNCPVIGVEENLIHPGDSKLVFNGNGDMMVADDELAHGVGQILAAIGRAARDDDAISLNRDHPYQGEQQAQQKGNQRLRFHFDLLNRDASKLTPGVTSGGSNTA